MTVSVRPAICDDVAVIFNFIMLQCKEEGTDVPVNPDPTIGCWRDVYSMLNDPNVHILIAEVDGEDAGMIIAAVSDLPRMFERHAIVNNLYVKQRFRKTRVVLALIKEAMALGRSLGIQWVVTQVRGKNIDRQFYERLGWRKTSEVLCLDLGGEEDGK